MTPVNQEVTILGCQSCNRGFTLVELAVAVAILAIIAGIAVPSFARMINASRLTSATNEVVAALQTARMEAIRRNTRVVLCPTSNGSACTNANDWSRILVFVDTNSDASVGAGEVILKDVAVAKPGVGLSVVALDSLENTAAAATRMRFGADGRARLGTSSSGVVALTSTKLPSAERARRIEIAASRISVCASGAATSGCQ